MDFYCFDGHKWHCCVLFLFELLYAKLVADLKGCGKTLLVELLNIIIQQRKVDFLAMSPLNSSIGSKTGLYNQLLYFLPLPFESSVGVATTECIIRPNTVHFSIS
jgi:hypothetical protein